MAAAKRKVSKESERREEIKRSRTDKAQPVLNPDEAEAKEPTGCGCSNGKDKGGGSQWEDGGANEPHPSQGKGKGVACSGPTGSSSSGTPSSTPSINKVWNSGIRLMGITDVSFFSWGPLSFGAVGRSVAISMSPAASASSSQGAAAPPPQPSPPHQGAAAPPPQPSQPTGSGSKSEFVYLSFSTF